MLCSRIPSFARAQPLFSSSVHPQIPILGASLFLVTMILSSLRVFCSKGWFLWSLVLAGVLESIGFIAFAIHAQDNTHHVAFLLSFSATTIAPVLILIANMQTFARLIKSEATACGMHHDAQLWFRMRLASTAFTFLQCLAFPILSWAIYDLGSFLSPRDMAGVQGAIARLAHYDRGLSLLVAANGFQVLLCAAFGAMALAYLTQIRSQATFRPLRCRESSGRLLLAINAVNGLVLLRSVYKIIEFASVIHEALSFATTGPSFWAFDALPILVALIVFCAVDPASSLSESFEQNFGRQAVFLDSEAVPSEKEALLQ